MRAAAAFDISVCRFEWWRLACGSASVVSALVLLSWCLAEGRVGYVLPIAGAGAVAVCMAFSAMAMAMAIRRPRSVRLRWDTQRWTLGAGEQGPAEDGEIDTMLPGQLSVAIDLGPWLLLKFVRQPAQARGAVWLPVQRRGLDTRWHALRCALYGARAQPLEPVTRASSARH